MKLSNIPSNPKVLLYGYGLEGQSSEKWIKNQFPQAVIEVYEDLEKGESLHPSLTRGRDIEWKSYDVIIKSPGVPPKNIPAEFWPKETSNFRLFIENLNDDQRAKVIGITGSKGKSTTAKFTHELLQKAGFNSVVIGNYGVPALDVCGSLDSLDYLVAECSSFQLYDLEVSPKYALFLSFFPDHLDWHNDSKMDYLAAKQNLWKYQKKTDYLLVPQITHDKCGVKGLGTLIETRAVVSKFFPLESILQAPHFRENLGTVWALAEVLKIKDLPEIWTKTARAFEPIEHRLEFVRDINGIKFYNDSIATSPEATIAGINWLKKDLSGLILDGQDLGLSSFKDLVETLVEKSPQARVALIESDMAEAFELATTESDITYQRFTNYETALDWLLKNTQSGAILFSPGGKSFNRFKNYSERGKSFKALVLGL